MSHTAARRSRRGRILAAATGLAGLFVLAGWTGAAPATGAPIKSALAPVAVDDTYSTPMDTVLSVPAPGMLGNDLNLPDNVNYRILTDANHNAANSFSPNGTFAYTPDTGYVGDDAYTYCIATQFEGGDCLSNTATITIHVIGPPPAPKATDDVYYVHSGDTLTLTAPGILGNDTDLPPSSSYELLTGAAHKKSDNFNADGSASYTPVAGYVGDDSYTYCITAVFNSEPCLSEAATITIHVQPALPTPHASNDTYSTKPGKTLTVAAPGIFGNDTNLPDIPTFKTLTSFTHSDDVDINLDGSLVYGAVAGYSGDDTATYCLTESAEDPTCTSNVATVTIHIIATATPEAPTASPTTTTTGLSDTGFPARISVLVGILAVTTGALLMTVSRRRRGQHS